MEENENKEVSASSTKHANLSYTEQFIEGFKREFTPFRLCIVLLIGFIVGILKGLYG